ncbi:molybdenum ABC transporter ATP-binding protein [Actibacterium sp. 188UL27-1]|uniref:molybdenum ABC transporter ATP-binding protein n=1 Tax=Actibacterium sp. 188UL27-1 TaxID=2786961 RepID=UPI00195AE67C|nr:molybdenum ABC transporter ATP-binding protein [Actibacterium sp. 188UL27-1]MBM7067472.1 molybdenum ABC transporter ATP-binding protein [Actibacterium sp. 188UL27-1]
MSLSVAITHRHGDFTLDVAFEAPPGVTVLFGRSGAGKTTVANAVAGILKPDTGRIAVDDLVLVDQAKGVWLPPHRRRLGYIFQEGRLFPHLTVRQNLAYGRWFAPRDRASDDMARIVELLGIGHLLDRRPVVLSGGEKQRVAIGRAVLARPTLILADEPLAALDAPRKAEILTYFERLRDEVAIPVLYVTHAVAEVARLATTVVALRDGAVARVGPAAAVLGDPSFTPAGIRAVGAVLEVVVARHHADGLTEVTAGQDALFLPRIASHAGTRLRIRIAAQDVLLSRDRPTGLSALNILGGRIETIRPGEGPGAIVSLNTSAGLVLARVTQRSVKALGLTEGMICHAVIKTVATAPEDVGGQIKEAPPPK